MCPDGEEDPVTLLLLGRMWKTQGLVLRLQSSFSILPNVVSTGANTSHSYSCDLPALKLEGKKKTAFMPTISIFHIATNQILFFPLIWEGSSKEPWCLISGFPLNLFSSHLSRGSRGVGGWTCWYLKTEGLPGMWGPRKRKRLICWPWVI